MVQIASCDQRGCAVDTPIRAEGMDRDSGTNLENQEVSVGVKEEGPWLGQLAHDLGRLPTIGEAGLETTGCDATTTLWERVCLRNSVRMR